MIFCDVHITKVKKWVGLSFLSTFFFLTSCKSDIVFHGSHLVNNQQLSYTDSVGFDFIISDTSSLYDLVLDVTYLEDNYPYENLYTKVKTYFPNGMIVDDIISFEFRSHDAVKNTKCRSGKCIIPIYLQSGIAFETPGNYRIEFVQNSRDSLLNGIYNFDLDILKSK